MLSPLVPWSFSSGRPRSDGLSRLWLRQSEKSGEQGFCESRSKSKVVLGPGLPIEEAVRRRLESEASAPVGEVGQSSRRAGAVPFCPDVPVGGWTALSAYCSRPLGWPMSCVLSVWAEPWRGSRSPRDPGFMNPTGAPEPPSDSGRIIWGILFLAAGARERTHGCNPRAVQAESSRGFYF